jgi:hypothetical protein
MGHKHPGWKEARTSLTALARDTRANTIAMMAMALIPLAGMVGGGVDISRMYIVKTRLQHACDAGALAGRKAMGGGTWTQTVGSTANYPRVMAEKFFEGNYDRTAYGAIKVTRRFTESAGKVSGTASATVPMTLMRIFGKTEETLSVTCDAEMRLPNTDVMFVLDTTGSMNYCPNGSTSCNGGPNSRIAALRKAVKCFYQIVARLDVLDTDCDGDEPSGGTGNQVQIRFGFVPYSTNVNVGRLLQNDWIADTWPYQTRQPDVAVPPEKTDRYWQVYGSSLTQADCLKFMNNQPFDTFTPTPTNSGGPPPAPTVVTTITSDGTATSGGDMGEWGWSSGNDPTWGSWGRAADNSTGNGDNKKSCRRKRTDVTTYYQEKFQYWDYNQFDIDVSGLKAGGSNWKSSFTMPSSTVDPNTQSIADATVGNDVPQAVITWDGCIEERKTVETTDFDPIPIGAKDLDIDLVPDSDETRWGPALPQLIFTRRQTSNGINYSRPPSDWPSVGWERPPSWNRSSQNDTTTDYTSGMYYACPTPAKKLQAWPSASDFGNYVDSLRPDGATYHDIGIIWGARLMSPTGIFKSENATTPKGAEIERHMIFMTDGDTNANDFDYAAYGLPYFDDRQTDDYPTANQLNEQVNLRFLAVCNWVRNKNITLWVINFGEGQAQATQDRLRQCASTGRYFSAANSAALQQTFKSIADQISQLRLTK